MKKALLLLIVGTVFGYWVNADNVLPQSVQHMLPSQLQSHQAVKGASTTALPTDVSGLQKELENLPVSSIATSSPQGQAIIHWFQKLPADQLKKLCQGKCTIK